MRNSISSGNLLSTPQIKTIGVDTNRDGKPDFWNITARVRKPRANLILRHLDTVTAFDYNVDNWGINIEAISSTQDNFATGINVI